MMTRLIRNSRGQVAIFIALLFQVLFLFFAMIVNVGLLVHHKINLQNSVDLAAYYGAMKQAEVLNAIAHVNYQIRQSWKLLVWRQRVLGSAGAMSGSAGTITPWERLVTSNVGVGERPAADGTAFNSNYTLPRFCITYDPHEVGSGGTLENSCKNMHTATSVLLPNSAVLSIPSFFNFGTIVAGAINQAVQNISDRCTVVGALNYLVGARFTLAHDVESLERAYLINYLSTGLSVEEDNFYEINGDSAKLGVEKTLSKNLTEANKANIQFKMLNGLALGQCRKQAGNVGLLGGPQPPPPWLVPIEIYPVWRYLDCNSLGTGATSINSSARQLVRNLEPARLNNLPTSDNIRQAIESIRPSMTPRPVLIGYEKDPWCMAYVGVKATAKPKIPFMPISDVEIAAESYSKPFGGRTGPWYVSDWPQGQQAQGRINQTANNPNVANKLEFASPGGPSSYGGNTRVSSLSGITNPDDPSWVPNVARFPGDTLGFASEQVLAYFQRALKTPGNTAYQALGSGAGLAPYQILTDPHPSMNYYENIGTPYGSANPGRDQLTWVTNSGAPRERLLEIAAVAPNLFDMAYYSIDPNFYGNYFTKIEDHKRKRGGFDSTKFVLGDMGSRFDLDDQAKAFNIFDQLKIQRAIGNPNQLNSDVSMAYASKNAAHLLNSWTVNNLLDYTQNDKKFGRCLSPASGDGSGNTIFDNPITPAIPGNCINGGRVGYSVKMVAKEYLKDSSLELGGQGNSGALRNPPPDNW